MRISCPACAIAYDVPDGAIGPAGRKLRCKACGHSWREPGPPSPAPSASAPAAPPPEPAAAPAIEIAAADTPDAFVHAPPFAARRRWRPWLVVALIALVAALGAVAAVMVLGSDDVARRLGAGGRVPLGIRITRPPDWRTIAGGSQLFAVSGRIWNPTTGTQPVPDIRAELSDAKGRVVYRWTITRPVRQLAPGASTAFDGAAIDVPQSSVNVSVAFVGESAP